VQTWAKVRTSSDAIRFKDFVDRYPASPLVIDARERLAAIEQGERARAEQERIERERLSREKSERERLERERLAHERIAREQAERDRLAREQSEREQRPQDEAERERQEKVGQERRLLSKETPEQQPGMSSNSVQTAMLARPPSEPTLQPSSPPALAGGALIRKIKIELKRVGCYGGPIDEKWTTATVQASIDRFAKRASLQIPSGEPTSEFLDAIRGKSGTVCPPECTARQVEKAGGCVAKTCPAGVSLNDSGKCEKRGVRERTAALLQIPSCQIGAQRLLGSVL